MTNSKSGQRQTKAQNFIWWFVMISLLASIIYVVIETTLSPATADVNMPYQRIKGDYVLILSQCVFGVFAMLLPSILNKKLNLIIPSNMLIVYTLFLYCAIFLGEVRNFYYSVPYWDTILHTFSGAMLGSLGFSFISFLNKSERIPVNLSPVFVAVFTFCFALTLGVVWEFYEFFCDALLDTNMQKFALESGDMLVGHDALSDTMKDLIVDAIGGIFISIVGYISLKFKKGWVEKLILKFKR
ncbi:MAG: hypothetical protein E7410_03485 [Ruminococcaceae bacterium]|nr:hypothetical protein [Oscillospiraceae bacterium]